MANDVDMCMGIWVLIYVGAGRWRKGFVNYATHTHTLKHAHPQNEGGVGVAINT